MTTCPHCEHGDYQDGYCYACGYDAELEADLIDQVDDGYTDSEFDEDND